MNLGVNANVEDYFCLLFVVVKCRVLLSSEAMYQHSILSLVDSVNTVQHILYHAHKQQPKVIINMYIII